MHYERDKIDIYFDRMQLTVTIFGVNMTLALSSPHPDKLDDESVADMKDVATIRTSLNHAKIMTMLLRKQLKQYEEKSGSKIFIPVDVYEGLKLNEADW